MNIPFSIRVKFDLLKVGHCQHPECAALRGGGRQAIEFPALVGLIEHPQQGLILYDTGYSRHFNEATQSFPECLYRMITPVTLPPEEALLAQLESRGIRASDIGTIVISHFHADHVAGMRDFPQARFIATSAERILCEKKGRIGRLRRAYLRQLLPEDLDQRLLDAESMPVLQMPTQCGLFDTAHDSLGDGSLLGINLPGHTASQLGVVFHAEETVFLIGDACWKVEGLIRDKTPSRLAYALFDNGATYDTTFAKLRALYLSPDAPRIIPSHCITTWRECGGTRRICRD